MNPTLALDALLTDPHFPQIAAKLEHLIPTSFLDQVAAAGAHTSVIRDKVSALLDADPADSGWLPAAQVPDWIRLAAYDTLARWFAGTIDTCRHNPVPDHPQPVSAAAWKPGLIVCLACTHLLKCRPGSLEERTCDGCGHECTGPENDDGIWPALTQAGVLLYEYGVCGDCKAALPRPVRPC